MASGKEPQLQLLLSMIIIRIMVLGMDLKVADYYNIISCCNDLIGRLLIVSEWRYYQIRPSGSI